MTEYIPTIEDMKLEATIRRLFNRLEEVREGSAEYRMIVRQLRWLRKGEINGLIFEERSPAPTHGSETVLTDERYGTSGGTASNGVG